jgi:beta-glucuronidase
VYDSLHFIAGVIYFCLNDYRTHIGEEGIGRFQQRVHGIIDINGNKKPSYDSLRKLFSPITRVVYRIVNHKIQVQGINHDGIPSYALVGFKAVLKNEVTNELLESADLPAILPGNVFNIIFNYPGKGRYSINFFTSRGWCVNDYIFNLN